MTRFYLSLLALLSFFAPSTARAQLQTFGFSDLDSLQANEKRKVVVFIHTDWCKYCNQMKNTTFKNEDVVKLLNNQFYFIDLNAESKADITYCDRTFKYRPNGANTGVHELAEQLATIEGKLNYPTICILNEKNEIVFQYGVLMKSDEILAVLNKLSGKEVGD